jgi:hypothetical protein
MANTEPQVKCLCFGREGRDVGEVRDGITTGCDVGGGRREVGTV